MENSFAISLCFSTLVVLISIIPLSLGRIKAGYSVKNMSAPRALFDKLPDFGKRAVWCHQNCWESISLHAPACLLCLFGSVDSQISLIASLAHPLLRFFYIGAYIFDLPPLRGIFWASGLLCTLIMLKEGLFSLIFV